MDLYFLRHGDALGKEEWKGDDNARVLSEEGAARMLREARTMAELSLGIALILSSPLLRALKTAQIVAESLGLQDSLLTDKRLSPGFEISPRCGRSLPTTRRLERSSSLATSRISAKQLPPASGEVGWSARKAAWPEWTSRIL